MENIALLLYDTAKFFCLCHKTDFCTTVVHVLKVMYSYYSLKVISTLTVVSFIFSSFSLSLSLSFYFVSLYEQLSFHSDLQTPKTFHFIDHHTDVDECEHSAGDVCDHECVNTVGSFLCRCHTGYILASDQRSCIPVHNCKFLCSLILLRLVGLDRKVRFTYESVSC